MLISQRIFVESVRQYCLDHEIAIEVRSDGWLIVMRRGPRRHLAFGYDVGLNSATAHQIANDKAATAELLKLSGVPCIPHTLFLGPKRSAFVPASRSPDAMLRLLTDHPGGLVVKPNEGTSGECVFMVTTKPALERAVAVIFSAYPGLAISPFVNIEDEVRVVLVDDLAVVVYSKSRPSVVGDGEHSLLELARAATPEPLRSRVLADIAGDMARAELDAILPMGQRRVLNWRHNLDFGARPVLVEAGEIRNACVRTAVKAAQAIGIRFGSIDVVRVDGAWHILEVNSGVKMEALGRLHPDLVHAAYHTALDKVFG
ncbi:ATP-grasp domain-containing protein [Bradyrhizobium sp.]|uniref:ATP-grasp domain-containing protein n=1 Tax=Bradyrhizobium sp. TaxID=376 RepID=UPI003C76D6B2